MLRRLRDVPRLQQLVDNRHNNVFTESKYLRILQRLVDVEGNCALAIAAANVSASEHKEKALAESDPETKKQHEFHAKQAASDAYMMEYHSLSVQQVVSGAKLLVSETRTRQGDVVYKRVLHQEEMLDVLQTELMAAATASNGEVTVKQAETIMEKYHKVPKALTRDWNETKGILQQLWRSKQSATPSASIQSAARQDLMQDSQTMMR